ncbi:hypothetical protein DFJ74DRAFT_680800 [Hyaloraphidium curvatum]|nr:hypothetical protein DFJ74DRAFT_680800 [Hyaloraphidium curvatum]
MAADLMSRALASLAEINLPRIAGAFVGMWTLHYAADRVFVRLFGSRVVDRLSRKDRLHMDEKVCSTANSVMLSVSSILVCFRDQAFRPPGAVFDAYPPLVDDMFSNYLGYVLYDAIVMHLQGGEHWTMWLHHAMGISGALTILTHRQLVYFPVFFGLTELTAFTTNMLWYVQKIYPLYLAEYAPRRANADGIAAKSATKGAASTSSTAPPVPQATSFSSRSAHISSDPRAVKLLSATLFTRALSFFVFRVWVFPYTLYYAFGNVGGVRPFLERFKEMPFMVKLLTVTNVTLMGSLNFIWTFWITMKWRGFEKKRREAAKGGGGPVVYQNESDEFDSRDHEITEKLIDLEAKKAE